MARAALEVLSTRPGDIERAARIVRAGGTVAFPTDTVYGLGCDPRNSRALSRVLSVKGTREKPLPILVASEKLADQIAIMDSRARALASRFWPGPLTIVLRPRVHFPRSLTMGRKTIAVRCPGNRTALRLIRKCGGFLTGTSANIAGHRPCTSARMVDHYLGDRVDAVVDGGRSPRRSSSTVVRVHPRGVTMLRKGPIRDGQVRRTLQMVPPPRNRRQ
ncbi:L-threonylcarbamoyladenylate synthase [[Eubacterium] cellulosolvens]